MTDQEFRIAPLNQIHTTGWGRKHICILSSAFQKYHCVLCLYPKPFRVIPAEAGIQISQAPLDPGFRRGDGILESGVPRMIWLYLSHLGFNEKQIRERTYEKLY